MSGHVYIVGKLKNPDVKPPAMTQEQLDECRKAVAKYPPKPSDSLIEYELPKVGAVYQHYKGNKYFVYGIAIHTETGEKMVIYKGIGGMLSEPYWVRPASMWFDEVDEGVFRFTKVEVNDNENG